MKAARILQIMQLADSALPVGGFAFSGGLEWMVKTRCLDSLQSFDSYIRGLIRQAGSFELPFIHSFCGDECWAALADYRDMLYLPSMNKASITQGRAWMRLFPSLFKEPAVVEAFYSLRSEMRERGEKPHFLFALSRSLCFQGYESKEIAMLFLFMLVRDQMSAALRLGIIGPGQSQELLSGTLEEIERTVEQAAGRDYTEAWRNSAILDIAQAGHKDLYSKLFQN